MAKTVRTAVEHFAPIQLTRPPDAVIQKIRELVSTGVLKPGDRLPPERELAKRLGVGRSHVREALRRLEFYGIVRTLPQSGTVVANDGTAALEGLLRHVVDLENQDLDAVLEARAALEIHAARLAAARASDTAVAEVGRALEAFRGEVAAGRAGLEADTAFHLALADATGNRLLRALLGLLSPDVIARSADLDTCRDGRHREALREHESICAAIRARDPERAAAAMTEHMRASRRQFETASDDQPPQNPRR